MSVSIYVVMCLVLFVVMLCVFFSGLGYAMVFVSAIIGIYYNIVISHVLLFLFVSLSSMKDGLPWTSCGNWWNTDQCYVPDYGKSSDMGETRNGTAYSNMTDRIQDSVDATRMDNGTAAITAGISVLKHAYLISGMGRWSHITLYLNHSTGS